MDDTTLDLFEVKCKRGRQARPPTQCNVEGCDRDSATKGMCAKHYMRFLRHGNTEGILDFGDPVERFHKKYVINPETGCWEWACYRHPKGYGILGIGKYKKVRAHRFSYEQFVGPIPEGLQVCHKCDVRKCVNPNHLFVGTSEDNVRDMWAKGRGTIHGRKLTWPMVTNIRVLYARGMPFTSIAVIYGIDQETARQIVKGGTWLNHPVSY
jgi:hypothetical protein